MYLEGSNDIYRTTSPLSMPTRMEDDNVADSVCVTLNSKR